MMRVDRLRELVRGTGSVGQPSRRMDARSNVGEEASTQLGRVADVLGGAFEPSAEGNCLVVRRTYSSANRYGRCMVGDYPAPGDELLDILGGSTHRRGVVGAEPAEPGPIVCLDLETTGLSGGAGTIAFLIGLGWFECGGFRTCQYVLTNLAGERRMLKAAATVLARAKALLTFNGKSFDVPVAETRWSLHRLPSPFDALPHVDLLHPARRLWRADQGRLVSLERVILGVRRVADVPGAEIPSRYVGFLREG